MKEIKDLRKFYIDGCWVDANQANDFDVTDPSTEETVAIITLGKESDTNKAVQAAKDAFKIWSQTLPEERLHYVEKILEIYQQRAMDMAQAISTEMGAPIDMSIRDQVGCGTEHIEAFIDAFKKFQFIKPLRDDALDTMVAWEPIGVVAAITPWNWPMNQITLKVIPAILGGNTVILKPSEISPLSAIVWAEILHEAGLPKGVFNLVNGDGLGVGSHLSSHPDVDMISFTGSTRAGIAITKTASESLKKVALELGGKGANIIFADVGKATVIEGVRNCFDNTGQSCNAPTRMLVERKFYDEAVQIAKEAAESIKVGSAHQHGNHIGPVISEQQWHNIQTLISKGIDEGVTLLVGGLGKPEGYETGYFVKPTIFSDATENMSVVKQEIFGPVLTIMPFDTEEDVIALTNDTEYGLTNYINTKDIDRLKRLSRQVKSGMVVLNGQAFAKGSAFGGVKASGRAREGGVWGLEEFMDSKFISGWVSE